MEGGCTYLVYELAPRYAAGALHVVHDGRAALRDRGGQVGRKVRITTKDSIKNNYSLELVAGR